MCAQNIHTFFHRIFSDMEQCHDLFHADCINFISCLDLLTGSEFFIQRYITGSLRFSGQFAHTFTFCFAIVEKCAIILCQLLQGFFICFIVRKPCISSFHNIQNHLSFDSQNSSNIIPQYFTYFYMLSDS